MVRVQLTPQGGREGIISDAQNPCDMLTWCGRCHPHLHLAGTIRASRDGLDKAAGPADCSSVLQQMLEGTGMGCGAGQRLGCLIV